MNQRSHSKVMVWVHMCKSFSNSRAANWKLLGSLLWKMFPGNRVNRKPINFAYINFREFAIYQARLVGCCHNSRLLMMEQCKSEQTLGKLKHQKVCRRTAQSSLELFPAKFSVISIRGLMEKFTFAISFGATTALAERIKLAVKQLQFIAKSTGRQKSIN